MKSSILPTDFYSNPDVVDVSRNLLGKFLCTQMNGEFTSGMIIETEAYCGRNDKACHANNNKRTDRTEVMFGEPGRAYIYLCYGIHHLFNVVTNQEGLADAVLIRGIKPVDGLDIIKHRRQISSEKNLSNGPGKLTQALGIRTLYTGHDLSEPPIWIEDRGVHIADDQIQSTPRIGVDYAGDDALKPWRFT
ncbi:MAG: DNA-3-methyladenine glycosylase, partial [Balneolaceae bacterium]